MWKTPFATVSSAAAIAAAVAGAVYMTQGEAHERISVIRATYMRHIPRCTKETYITQTRPTSLKRDLHHSKETYVTENRPLRLKRDLHHSNR